ncbi:MULTISPECIES: ATP-dependent nuclease [Serratia]|uniref:ATP-dependent nuclease n=1 Tax=Serratia TaxID=613 RepID=UPI00186654B4|nr:AAA family ATPase [Serratia marcescens]MBS6088953.1 AAA family ATPase [Serratia marcescens]CAI1950302.1 recombination protein F [Serratia marcescens]HBC5200435.1 AAA family ATPase [Serratia marcescens]
MHISKVVLVNYRNFRHEKFLFEKGVNTIIGENGSGKSNLFRAIRIMLDQNLIRSAYTLNENDFHRGICNWKGHWIIINVEFESIDESETILSLLQHNGTVIPSSQPSKATYNLIFRPKYNIRKKLSELPIGDIDGLNLILSDVSIDDYETIFTGRSEADFSNPDVYKSIVGDFDAISFPKKIDNKLIGIQVPLQLSVSKEISFNFIKALRDVVSEFNNNRLNPLLNLLRHKSENVKQSDYSSIIGGIKNLNSDIESLGDVVDVRNNISDTLRETVGESYSPKSMAIKSGLPEDAENLLKSLNLFVGESSDGYMGDINELSLGGANLIYIALKILEFKYKKSKKESANFLLIEEPEAHIHTHIQRTLFDNVNYDDTQIIYSTHSTQISEVSNIERVNILSKHDSFCCSYQPWIGLSETEKTHLQRYLDATRSSLLFSKGVVLVEGDAEEILIPTLIKKSLGLTLDELAISIINIGSTGFKNVSNIFHDKRVRRNCSIITDLDKAISETEILDEDTVKEVEYKNSMKRSEKKGEERKAILDKYTENNDYVKAFYAEHTFEVDFISARNSFEVEKTIDTVYQRQHERDIARKEIDHDEVGVYGRRVLKMANKYGKGWFALLLSDHINSITWVPLYIVRAILFAKGNITQSLCLRIIEYRHKEFSKFFPEDEKLPIVRECLDLIYCGKETFHNLKQTLIDNALDNIFSEILRVTNEN